jgi:peptidoglycan/xylan/chitin deacetylase (PgdA/CDA1 family)
MRVTRSPARNARWHRPIALGTTLAGVAVASHEGAAKPTPQSVVVTLVDQEDVADLICTGDEDNPPPPPPPPHGPQGGHGPHGQAGTASTLPGTIVSLTFDDTNDDQYTARSILAAHGMHATFFVNGSRIGRSGYMTLQEIQSLAADGNEIAGHTVSHVDLTTVDPTEQARQICYDRVTLLGLGFHVTSFAFPFGAANTGVEQVAQTCGYNSARGVGGIVSPGSCSGCPYSETTPPGLPYHLRTPDSIKVDTTLSDMQQYVVQAEQHGGGWVPLVMHHVCDGCNTNAVSAATLTAFLDWLKPRSASGTTVKTIAEVIGGAMQPPVPGPPPTTIGALQNGSLETATADGTPTCWQRGGYGTNEARWTRVDQSHSGASAQRVEVTSLEYGDQKLISRQDLGTCSPAVTPGIAYRVSAWYMTNAPSRLIVYLRDSAGGWSWWAQSPQLALRSTWGQATWTTPPMPAGTTAISIGLSVRDVGWALMDDFALSPAP